MAGLSGLDPKTLNLTRNCTIAARYRNMDDKTLDYQREALVLLFWQALPPEWSNITYPDILDILLDGKRNAQWFSIKKIGRRD